MNAPMTAAPSQPLPLCARCLRPVERVTSWEAESGFLSDVAFTIRVECHGEQETVEVTRAELVECTSVSMSTAFRTA